MKYVITYPLTLEIEADNEQDMWQQADSQVDEIVEDSEYMKLELHKHPRTLFIVGEDVNHIPAEMEKEVESLGMKHLSRIRIDRKGEIEVRYNEKWGVFTGQGYILHIRSKNREGEGEVSICPEKYKYKSTAKTEWDELYTYKEAIAKLKEIVTV